MKPRLALDTESFDLASLCLYLLKFFTLYLSRVPMYMVTPFSDLVNVTSVLKSICTVEV